MNSNLKSWFKITPVVPFTSSQAETFKKFPSTFHASKVNKSILFSTFFLLSMKVLAVMVGRSDTHK